VEVPPDRPAHLEPGFFDGRVLVEIEAWNCGLSVGLSSELAPRQYCFQGGLDVTQGFDIDGRVRAPGRFRDQRVSIHLTPFGPEFGEEWDEVGRLYFHPNRAPERPPLSATLFVPQTTLPLIATCLSAVWRYIHIWTFDEDQEEASIRFFGFDNEVHKNLTAWVAD
jgi:hypothetical protein